MFCYSQKSLTAILLLFTITIDIVGTEFTIGRLYLQFSKYFYNVGNCDFCPLKFNFCLTSPPQKQCFQSFSVILRLRNNEVLFGKNIGSVLNPMRKALPEHPNVSFTIALTVLDTTTGEVVDEFEKTPNVTFWSNDKHPTVVQKQKWKAKHTNSLFVLSVYAVCENNRYGPKCSVKCIPSHNYACDADTGAMICKRGWRGTACTLFNKCLVRSLCSNGQICEYESPNSEKFKCVCPPERRGLNCSMPTETVQKTDSTVHTESTSVSTPTSQYNSTVATPTSTVALSSARSAVVPHRHVVIVVVSLCALVLTTIVIMLIYKITSKYLDLKRKVKGLLPIHPISTTERYLPHLPGTRTNPYETEEVLLRVDTSSSRAGVGNGKDSQYERFESLYEDLDRAADNEVSDIFDNPNYETLA